MAGGGGGGGSACSQAQEGGVPTYHTMLVVKGQKWKRVGKMKQRMRHRVDEDGGGGGGGELEPQDLVHVHFWMIR